MNLIQRIFVKIFLLNEDTRKEEGYFISGYSNFSNISIVHRDERLYSFIHVPLDINEYTECIFVFHGRREHRRDTVSTYEIVGDNKNLYLIVDYRGFGENQSDFDKDLNNEDLLAWMEYVNKNYGVSRFKFIGHSLGANICISFYRYLLQQKISFIYKILKIVLVAPFYDILSVTLDFITEHKFLRKHLVKMLPLAIPSSLNYDIEEDLEYIKANSSDHCDRMYIYHGSNDTRIKKSHSENIVKRFGINYKECKNEDHDSIFKNSEIWTCLKEN